MADFRVMSSLILKRASASRPSGAWDDDDFDVLTAKPAGRIENSGISSPERREPILARLGVN